MGFLKSRKKSVSNVPQEEVKVENSNNIDIMNKVCSEILNRIPKSVACELCGDKKEAVLEYIEKYGVM